MNAASAGPDLSRPQRGAVQKIANIIANGGKDHDFRGVERELAGEDTGYDHVTEMKNNVRGLHDALGSIRGSLANPTLAFDARAELERAIAVGQAMLARMESVLTGRRQGGK